MKKIKLGLIYIFTGDGKGKTSAALGTALRAIGHGKQAAMVQFYKTSRWRIGEHKFKNKLFQIYPMGKGFYFLSKDRKKHQKAAQAALKFTAKLLATKGYSFCGGLFIIILDEVLNAVHDQLIDLNDLIDLISKRGKTHIILTGRHCPKELIVLADLVTEMKNLKHPFQKNQKAVFGLDY